MALTITMNERDEEDGQLAENVQPDWKEVMHGRHLKRHDERVLMTRTGVVVGPVETLLLKGERSC